MTNDKATRQARQNVIEALDIAKEKGFTSEQLADIIVDCFSELQPVNPDDEKAAEDYASKSFPDKSAWEYHNQYASYLAGRKSLRKLQPVNKTDDLICPVCGDMLMTQADLKAKNCVGCGETVNVERKTDEELVSKIEKLILKLLENINFRNEMYKVDVFSVSKGIASILPGREADTLHAFLDWYNKNYTDYIPNSRLGKYLMAIRNAENETK